MAGLGAFGIAFIYSAQLPVQGRGWIVQLVWLVLGAGVYVAVSLIDYQFWLGVAHWFYAALPRSPGPGPDPGDRDRGLRLAALAPPRALLLPALGHWRWSPCS